MAVQLSDLSVFLLDNNLALNCALTAGLSPWRFKVDV